MKVTFLIGNGYDLNLGLKTTYKDFYKNYVVMLDKKAINNNVLYSSINTDIEDWVDFETRLGLSTFPVDSNDINQALLLNQSKNLSDENINIENEINTNLNVTNEQLLSSLVVFRKDLKKYFLKESAKLKGYNSLLGHTLKEGLLNFASDFDDNEKLGIYSNMAAHVTEYTGTRIGDRLSIDYSFLTFNYTDFLEIGQNNIKGSDLSSAVTDAFANENYNSFEVQTELGQIYHVHSKLSDGMFLGVDNDKQLYSKRFNKKELTSLIKPLSNEKYNNNITDKADQEIFYSDVIVIYGMALGVTDSTWWEKVIAFLQKNSSNILLIHKFDSEINIEDDDFYYLEDRKEDIKDHLLSFNKSLTSEEITNLKNKIYVKLNSSSIFDSSILKTAFNDNEKKKITYSRAN